MAQSTHSESNNRLTVAEICIFGLLGGLMFASKKLMEFMPNVHLLGTFIVSMTVVFRKKALFPLYTYVLINGFFEGFATWWLPYLYIWAVLWGATMLLPKKMPMWLQPIVYAVVSSLHGFLFGTLYAPAQALLFGLSFKAMLAWIAAGFPWDCIHGVGNLVLGLLIVPLIKLLRMCVKYLPKNR